MGGREKYRRWASIVGVARNGSIQVLTGKVSVFIRRLLSPTGRPHPSHLRLLTFVRYRTRPKFPFSFPPPRLLGLRPLPPLPHNFVSHWRRPVGLPPTEWVCQEKVLSRRPNIVLVLSDWRIPTTPLHLRWRGAGIFDWMIGMSWGLALA